MSGEPVSGAGSAGALDPTGPALIADDVVAMLLRRGVLTTDRASENWCCGTRRDEDGFCMHRPGHPVFGAPTEAAPGPRRARTQPWSAPSLSRTEPCQIPRSWGRRKLRRLIQQQHDSLAWERWKLDKVINDYDLVSPAPYDGSPAGPVTGATTPEPLPLTGDAPGLAGTHRDGEA
jgi:hypothetical protein